MYPNYINDRKSLGYECLADIECGYKLVVIIDSTVLLLKNHSSKIDSRKKCILAVVLRVTVIFSNPKPTKAVGMYMPRSPQQELVVQQ